MVCKIRSGKNIKGALNYNEHKVKEGAAECIGAANFIGGPEHLTIYDKVIRFEQLTERNARSKTNCVHISLNFEVSEKLNQNKLNDIARDYMHRIGFDDQPYLVYQHHDAAHPHLHIVTTNIQGDGKRIPIHNLGKNQSENARKEIEEKYGLIKAGSTPKQKPEGKLKKAVYGKSATKKTIDKIVSEVMTRYKYSSLAEFNAALGQYNVLADRGKEGMEMFRKNGLLFSMIDAKGRKVGVPIKASALLCRPTMKNLEKHFERGAFEKQAVKGRLTNIIDSFFHERNHHTADNLSQYMKNHGIHAVFRENQGRVYGLTIVDTKSGAVFNGSDLGKEYTGQALIKRMNSPINNRLISGEEKIKQPGSKLFEQTHFERNAVLESNWMPSMAKEGLGLMKADKCCADPTNPLLEKRKKKKKRGRSI
jgi:hypothetical protein